MGNLQGLSWTERHLGLRRWAGHGFDSIGFSLLSSHSFGAVRKRFCFSLGRNLCVWVFGVFCDAFGRPKVTGKVWVLNLLPWRWRFNRFFACTLVKKQNSRTGPQFGCCLVFVYLKLCTKPLSNTRTGRSWFLFPLLFKRGVFSRRHEMDLIEDVLLQGNQEGRGVWPGEQGRRS